MVIFEIRFLGLHCKNELLIVLYRGLYSQVLCVNGAYFFQLVRKGEKQFKGVQSCDRGSENRGLTFEILLDDVNVLAIDTYL